MRSPTTQELADIHRFCKLVFALDGLTSPEDETWLDANINRIRDIDIYSPRRDQAVAAWRHQMWKRQEQQRWLKNDEL